MSGFAENINYIAKLDHIYGTTIELAKSSLVTVDRLVVTVNVLDTITTQNTTVTTDVGVGFSTILDKANEVKRLLELAGMTVVVTVNTVMFSEIKFIITARADTLLYDATMTITSGTLDIPVVEGDVTNTFKVLPVLASMNTDVVSGLIKVSGNIEEVVALSNAFETGGLDVEKIGTMVQDITELQDDMINHIHTSAQIADSADKRFVTDVEKAKWNAIDTNAELRDRATHTGTQSLDTTTDSATRIAMTPAERVKLDGVDNRSNHTGTQSISTITETTDRKVMTADERDKLAGIEAGANAYVHPGKHNVAVLDGVGHAGEYVRVDENGVAGWDYVNWGDISGKPTAYVPTTHEHSLDDITSGTLSASRVETTGSRRFVTDDEKAIIADAETKASRGVPNGYVPLDANGKINASYLNDLNLVEVFTPANVVSMLQLASANPGDIAYVQDTEVTYMLIGLPSDQLSNWKPINTAAAVQSVNGKTGIVALSTSDISEGTNKYYTDERVDDRVSGLLQAGTNVSLTYDDVANTLVISANDTSINWGELQNVPTTVAGYGITDTYTKTEVHTTGMTLTNKILDSVTNKVGADHVHYKVKAMANLVAGDVVKIVGYNSGKDAVEVNKVTSASEVAVGMIEEAINVGEFGAVTNTGVVEGLDTTAWAFGTILYQDGTGGLTATKPASGVYQACAVVLRSNANTGALLVEFTEPQKVNWDDRYYTETEMDAITNEKQPIDSTLTALSGVEIAADKYVYATGSDTFTTGTITTFGRSLVDDVDSATARVTLDISAVNTPSTAVGSISATNVQDALEELDNEKLSMVVANASHIGRADKYLAAQAVANMVYTDGKLSKVQYNNATDVDYEVLTYGVDGKLDNVAHYVNSTLAGNTALSYAGGKLVSAIYTGV